MTEKKHQAAYKVKLPAMREWLIGAARSNRKVTYGEVMKEFSVDRFSLRHAMDYLGHQARDNNEPVLTAMVVNKKSRRCSPGLAKEFQVFDDEGERRQLHEYWSGEQSGSTSPAIAIAEPVTNRLAFAFQVGSPYHRKDVFRIIQLPEAPTGGNWFTGYTAHGDDWFIFCGVGTGGRTGHDYGNYFDGDRLVWFAKTNTTVHQPAIQKLIKPSGRVYVFFREDDRDPFTFAGLGNAIEVFDQTPVKVIWSFCGVDGARLPTQMPEEVDEEEVSTVPEGARRTVQVNIYERNPNARRKCIEKWGVKCSVCLFDFGQRYGELGEGFIHVHHLKPLGEVGAQYELNPVTDLRPVCPNCHAMLHRRKSVMSIEELKEHLVS
jgi:5-methylcytosine-specific restriction enzyme A